MCYENTNSSLFLDSFCTVAPFAIAHSLLVARRHLFIRNRLEQNEMGLNIIVRSEWKKNGNRNLFWHIYGLFGVHISKCKYEL